MDGSEYRGRPANYVAVPPFGLVMIGLGVFLAGQSGSSRGPDAFLWGVSGLGICFGVLLIVMGAVSGIRPRMAFYTEGFAVQGVVTPGLKFRWDQIEEVTIQPSLAMKRYDLPHYRVVVTLIDFPGYVQGLPEATRRLVKRDPAAATGGVAFDTDSIAVDDDQLFAEFRRHTTVPQGDTGPADVNALGLPTTVIRFVARADSAGARVIPHETSTVRFRTNPTVPIFTGIMMGLIAAVCFTVPGAFYLSLLPAAASAGCILSAFIVMFWPELKMEPEGLVYRGATGPELRIPWDQVTGVRVTKVELSGSTTVVLVTVQDVDRLVRAFLLGLAVS